MEELLIACAFAFVVALVVWLNVWLSGRSKVLIEKWASENGLELIHLESRWFRKGPYFWKSSKSQLVYFVTLLSHGQTRTAYIRCGGFWVGPLSDQIDITWE